MEPKRGYEPWRTLYRTSVREGTLPDMRYQMTGLGCYTRRKSPVSSSSLDQHVRPLAEQVSIELDLDQTLAKDLVASVQEWNPGATVWEVCQEHYSDRAAVLQALVDTRKRELGNPELVLSVAISTLRRLKAGAVEGNDLAGVRRPFRADLAKEWAAQKVKEECMLLEAIRTNLISSSSTAQDLITDEHCDELVRICFSELPQNNRALLELDSPVLREKELIRLERAWYSVLLPFLLHSGPSVTDVLAMVVSSPGTVAGGGNNNTAEGDEGLMDVPSFVVPLVLAYSAKRVHPEDFALNEAQVEQGLNRLLAVYSLDVVPQPDTYEKGSLREFMSLTVGYSLAFFGNRVSPSLWRCVETLCGLGFGYGEDDACRRFWEHEFPDLFYVLGASVQSLTGGGGGGFLLAQVSFGGCLGQVEGFLAKADGAVRESLETTNAMRLGDLDECRSWLARCLLETSRTIALGEEASRRSLAMMKKTKKKGKLAGNDDANEDEAAATMRVGSLLSVEEEVLEGKMRVVMRLAIVSSTIASSTIEGGSLNPMTLASNRSMATTMADIIRNNDGEDEGNNKTRFRLVQRICALSLRCIREMCSLSPRCRSVLLEARHGLESATTDVLNAVLAIGVAKHASGRVQLEALRLCLAMLSAAQSSSPLALWTSFEHDASILASRALRRHRRLSKYEPSIMSESFDVEMSIEAVRIAALIGRVDLDDAEILVRLMQAPQSSSRLADECRLALGAIQTECWAPVALNRSVLLHLFRVMPETDGFLLAKLVSSSSPSSSSIQRRLLGWIGPDSLAFCRRQVLDALRTMDVFAVDFLVEAMKAEPELGWTFFLDRDMARCLSEWMDVKYFMDSDPLVERGFDRIVLLLESLFANEQFRSAFLTGNALETTRTFRKVDRPNVVMETRSDFFVRVMDILHVSVANDDDDRDDDGDDQDLQMQRRRQRRLGSTAAHLMNILTMNAQNLLDKGLREPLEAIVLNFPSEKRLLEAVEKDPEGVREWIASWTRLGNCVVGLATTSNNNNDDGDSASSSHFLSVLARRFGGDETTIVLQKMLLPLTLAGLQSTSSSSSSLDWNSTTSLVGTIVDAMAFVVQQQQHGQQPSNTSKTLLLRDVAIRAAMNVGDLLLRVRKPTLLASPQSSSCVLKLAAIFVRLVSFVKEAGDDDRVGDDQQSSSSSPSTQQRRRLLPLACELVTLSSPSSLLTAPSLVLFAETCSETLLPEDESAFHLLRSALERMVASLNISSNSSGNDDSTRRLALRAMTRLACNAPMNHARLLVELNVLRVLPLGTTSKQLPPGTFGEDGDDEDEGLRKMAIADQLELVCALLQRKNELGAIVGEGRIEREAFEVLLGRPESLQIILKASRRFGSSGRSLSGGENGRLRPFTLSGLRDLRMIARTVRLLLASISSSTTTSSSSPSLKVTTTMGEVLPALFTAVGDLVEAGSRERGLPLGLLEEFAEQVAMEKMGKTSRQTSRLVLLSRAETREEMAMNASSAMASNDSIALLRMSSSSSFVASTTTPQDFALASSPMVSPVRSWSSPHAMTVLGGSNQKQLATTSMDSPMMMTTTTTTMGNRSPRPSSSSLYGTPIASTYNPLTPSSSSAAFSVTLFHLAVESAIEQCLYELFLLFATQVPNFRARNQPNSAKNVALFPLARTENNNNNAPDVITLLMAVGWIRRTLKQRAYSLSRARLACLVTLAIKQSLPEKPLDAEAARRNLETVRKRLFGEPRDQGAFSSLVKRMREEKDEDAAETMEAIAESVKNVFDGGLSTSSGTLSTRLLK